MEIPIIFEQKSKKYYDYIILMNVNKKIQQHRVMKRKKMTLKLLKKILSNQISNKKKKYADFVINNNGQKEIRSCDRYAQDRRPGSNFSWNSHQRAISQKTSYSFGI